MVPVFVVLTILVFIAIDTITERRSRSTSSEPLPITTSVPPGLFLHPGHASAELIPSGEVRVGLSGLLASALGVADRVVAVGEGTYVRAGEPLAQVCCGDREIELRAPVSGTVQYLNKQAIGTPANVTHAPYRSWVCALKPDKLGREISDLMLAEQASEWLRSEARRFSEWLALSSSPLASLPDGGLPVTGILSQISRDTFDDFTSDFLWKPEATRSEGR